MAVALCLSASGASIGVVCLQGYKNIKYAMRHAAVRIREDEKADAAEAAKLKGLTGKVKRRA
jgi:hypothetical protein